MSNENDKTEGVSNDRILTIERRLKPSPKMDKFLQEMSVKHRKALEYLANN